MSALTQLHRARRRPSPGSPSRRTTALVLAAAATAGFAVAVVRYDEQPAQNAAPVPMQTTALVDRRAAAEAAALTTVVGELDAARTSGRRALARARTAVAQARAAGALADAYATAGKDVRHTGAAERAALAPPLRDARSAYRSLATTARTGDPAGYRAATAAVTGAERRVAAALARIAG